MKPQPIIDSQNHQPKNTADFNCLELLRPDEAADFLRREIGQGSVKTLAKLRSIGGGPTFRKIGSRRIVYPKPDLRAWAHGRISAPLASTSSAT